ncbi:nuclear hormone receptor FTZ-F1-like protein [Leptotrombidium deliense]|uniref:Nuclear hormone receptor FTZ-F1-like protein n=1 Tax=Leptotrombidium deliense TaxID=299467 RepID=A0A443S872_9ACAR|nr:nuclear hormone receptor FTZ-F1-like protein [Leptotrombidium deliense]
MRGGRNKFGPMYKRDRARRLQLMRQRQMAIASIQSHPQLQLGNSSPGEVGGSSPFPVATINNVGTMGTPATIYTADGIKQELIQIPQLSSSTSSPDSSPSPGQTTLTTTHPSHFQTTTTSGGHASGHPLPSPLTMNVNHQEMIKWVQVSSASGAPSNRLSPKSTVTSAALQYTDSGEPSPVFGSSAGPVLPLTSGAPSGSGKIPVIIRELQMTAPDDKDWQSQLFGLLQNQTYNQCEVDLFELMCKVIDQSLFAQVDWARNSIFFKDLKVCLRRKLSSKRDSARHEMRYFCHCCH